MTETAWDNGQYEQFLRTLTSPKRKNVRMLEKVYKNIHILLSMLKRRVVTQIYINKYNYRYMDTQIGVSMIQKLKKNGELRESAKHDYDHRVSPSLFWRLYVCVFVCVTDEAERDERFILKPLMSVDQFGVLRLELDF